MLLMNAVLEQLQPGLVRDQLAPFEARLKALIGNSRRGADSILERIEVRPERQRATDPEHFRSICDATLRRKRLRMRYYSRHRNAEADRVVSPQRVIYYRGNWYLDAWCHDKQAGRRFAVDAIRQAAVLDEPALDEEPAPGNEEPGYGIFAGPADQIATLIFDAESARWVAEEEWHPHQTMTELANGAVQLEVPYSHPQEIMMDILRHGPHVEVVGPASLRSAVADEHRQAAEKYDLPKRSVASARTAADSSRSRAR
jgi:predicted DNA-binding transcriptional regulator YafY